MKQAEIWRILRIPANVSLKNHTHSKAFVEEIPHQYTVNQAHNMNDIESAEQYTHTTECIRLEHMSI